MIRLHITVEGQTEERFVKGLLAPYLGKYEVFADARSVLTSKDKRKKREYRGGFRRYNAYSMVRQDISDWMKEDNNKECRFTTMFDLYALPRDFPGKEQANQEEDPYKKVKTIEDAFSTDIGDRRFIPYIQLHEFEALILADPRQLEVEYFDRQAEIQKLEAMLAEAGNNPELINDRPETAPSKQIIKMIPAYNKVTAACLVAQEIGLDRMRQRCPHFNEWLTRLENLDVDVCQG